jgi:hypothetical protein
MINKRERFFVKMPSKSVFEGKIKMEKKKKR